MLGSPGLGLWKAGNTGEGEPEVGGWGRMGRNKGRQIRIAISTVNV